jgi:hypothetical protein
MVSVILFIFNLLVSGCVSKFIVYLYMRKVRELLVKAKPMDPILFFFFKYILKKKRKEGFIKASLEDGDLTVVLIVLLKSH